MLCARAGSGQKLAIRIVADRGVSARVSQETWDLICRSIKQSFRTGHFEQGLIEGICQITQLLASHFPAGPENVGELGNRPVIL